MNPVAKVVMSVMMRPCRFGWVFYPSNDTFVGGSFENYGEYSPVETRFLQAVVRVGDVVVAAGANIGGLVVPMAQKVGELGKVIAFEPQGFLWSLLKANVAVNGLKNVDTVYAAVGRECGVVQVPLIDYSGKDNYGGIGRNLWKKHTPEQCAEVDLVTVDSLKLPKLDLLQVDVESMEKEVLEGAAETIKKFRPKLFLENDKAETFIPLVEYVKGLGYVPYWVVTWLYAKDNFFESEKNVFPGACSFNMYCIPEERPQWRVEGLWGVEVTDTPGEYPGSRVIDSIGAANA